MNLQSVRTLKNGARVEDYGEMLGGDSGVDLTVRLMKEYAINDSESNAILKITNEIRQNYKTDIEQIKAAFLYVVTHINYEPDGKDEFVASPRHALTWLKQGDCDCMTTALFSLLIALGFKKIYAKVIAWKNDPTGRNEFTHVYGMALIPSLNKVIPLDPVMEYSGFGNEKSPVKRQKIYKIA